MPNYEIIEWNETNYDVRKIPYIAQAYDAKKFAFVSDYARIDILNEHGGIYFDTDVEVLKDLSPILEKGPFLGLETWGAIANGLGMASNKGDYILAEILESYQKEQFINLDGSYNLKTVVTRVSDIFRKHGFTDKSKDLQKVANYTIYPPEYFSPKDVATGIVRITENTYTIHHYDASWLDGWQKKVQKKKYQIYDKYGANIISKVLVLMYHISQAIINLGFINGIKYSWSKI
jgi:hypothetical protein